MANSLETFNIDGLDITFTSYFEKSDVTFAKKMKCISLDTKYLYELSNEYDEPDFTPLLKKLSTVISIGTVNLPRKEVCVSSGDGSYEILDNCRGYISFIKELLKLVKIDVISCPFVDDDPDLFVDVVGNIARTTQCSVKVIFPYLFPSIKVDVAKLKSDSKHLVTLLVPEQTKKPLGSYAKGNIKVDNKEYDMSKITKADPPPTNALNIYSSGGRGAYQSFPTTASALYFDAVPSQNLFWQTNTQYINLGRNWDKLDELGRNLYGLRSEQDMNLLDLAKGKLYIQKDSTGKVILEEDNVTIAILDTGIRHHEAFKNEITGKQRIIEVKNFINESDATAQSTVDWTYESSDHRMDRNGHGTHCASVAAGGSFVPEFPPSDAPPKLINVPLESGVAPFVNIIMCKIVTSTGYSKPQWMANAINWLIDEEKKGSFKVDIISTSVGYVKANLDLRKAVCRANMEEKIVVCAASNEGRRRATNIAFPGRFGDVICVGSHDKRGQPSNFSPIGREIDFLAPGENVWAAFPNESGKMVYPFDGTSAAAPFVAGIAALILLAAQRVTPDEGATGKRAPNRELRRKVSNITIMREIMRHMSTMHGHHDEATGYGNLDPWNVFYYSEAYFKETVQKVLDFN